MGNQKVDLGMSIPEFYKGKSILVTGFTGTVGKLIVEKLLYSCPDVKTIYVLVRTKKGQTPEKRIQQVLDSVAFSRVKKLPGNLERKVVGIPGDMMEDRLGLSEEDKELLRTEVNVIIHSAACVRFDEPIPYVVRVNTRASKILLDLALTMSQLLCFTYISTAFSNSNHFHIKEELYPGSVDWRKTLHICEKIDPATITILQAKYIDRMPNTYTFSKHLSENVMGAYIHDLPIIIVRPSIVCWATKEPIAGYLDNLNGAMGVSMAMSVGLIKCLPHGRNVLVNNIPSDIVTNAAIIASYKQAMTRKTGQNRDPVYNVCSPTSSLHSVEEFTNEEFYSELTANPRKDGIPCEVYVACFSELSYRINNLFREMLSSFIIDLFLLVKHQPMLFKIRRKIFILMLSLMPFTFHNYTFETTAFNGLLDGLEPSDRNEFGWELEMFDMYTNVTEKQQNARLTIFKPYYDDIKTNRKYLLALRIVDNFCVYLTYSVFGFCLYYFNIPILLLRTVTNLLTIP